MLIFVINTKNTHTQNNKRFTLTLNIVATIETQKRIIIFKRAGVF